MGKQYKVLRIQELTRIADLHGTEKYYRHTIKTAGGTVLTVDIDEADFKAEKATPILTAAAVEADKILEG